MSGTFSVRNRAQQILFEQELRGQISDGMWENSTPHDHWKAWSGAEIRVADTESELGRNFHVQRDRYNINSKALLDVVGDRMLGYVQAEFPGYTMADMKRDLKDLKDLMQTFHLPTPAERKIEARKRAAAERAKAEHDARIKRIAERANNALDAHVSPYKSRAEIPWDVLEKLLDAAGH